jgi:hypothetical protein
VAKDPARSEAIESTIDGYEEVSAAVMQQLDFAFDPYAHLEASGDPYLTRYLVQQESGKAATGSFHAAIFAPPGSGKTALRAYATQSSWVGSSGPHPFPVVYTPNDIKSVLAPQPAHFWRELGNRTARALLLGLTYRPERWHDLKPAERRLLVQLLHQCLLTPLDRYLGILETELDPAALIVRLERSYLIAAPPPPTAVRELCAAIRGAVRPGAAATDLEAAFFQLISLVRGPLGFGDVLLLVDGLDAFRETEADPTAILRWLAFLWERAEIWAERHIFLKLFLTDAVGDILSRTPSSYPKIDTLLLEWTTTELAEMLKRRLAAATGGRIDSMDAFAGPSVANTEVYLAGQVKPYPRDALLLVRRILYEFVTRNSSAVDELQAADIEAALAWYRIQAELVPPTRSTSKRGNGLAAIAAN